jgi:REP element-mobilizing transposase RayT
MKLKHSDWQRRIIFEDAIYFVTFYTENRYPYFREKIFCDLFVENLKLCKELKGFLLYGWVIIYEHIHLLLQPNDEWDISKVMQFLKRNISRNINFIMGFNNHDERTSVAHEDRSSPESGNDHCHFQGSPQISCSIQVSDSPQASEAQASQLMVIKQFIKIKIVLKLRFKIKYFNQNPFPKFKWHESFHDHYIRNDWDFNDKLEYIIWNPEKHGLPDDWQYVFTRPNVPIRYGRANPKYDELTDEIM